MASMKDEMVAYARSHPRRDGKSWSQWCGSLMVRFNRVAVAYLTANKAYDAATIVSTNPRKAPVGAFHYWTGHVGQDATGGGHEIFMASNYLAKSYGVAIGFNSAEGYAHATGRKYLGWSRHYGSNKAVHAFDAKPAAGTATASTGATKPVVKQPTPVKTSPAKPKPVPKPKPAPKPESDKAKVKRIAKYLNRRTLGSDTTASRTGKRGPVYWTIMQRAGRRDGLYPRGYVINGVAGPKTRALEKHYSKVAPK